MFRFIALWLLLTAHASAAPMYVLSAAGELPLHTLTVDIDVRRDLIRTRLDMAFINPYDKAVAATFIFALPAGAELDAYTIGREHPLPLTAPPAPPEAPSGWDFYETLPHIPAQQTQRVELTYIQPLAAQPPIYWLPLKGLLRLASLQVNLNREHAPVPVRMPLAYPFKATGEHSLSWQAHDFLPQEDILFGLAWPPPPNPELAKIRKTKAELEKIIADNERMAGSNTVLQNELNATRAELQAVEQRLQDMLDQQNRLLENLEQQLNSQ